jgi:hypothetical protein
VPGVDVLLFTLELVFAPVVERVVDPLIAELELSELVEPVVLALSEVVPAAVAGVPPPTTSGGMPLRVSVAHSGVVRHVPVAASKHCERSCVLLGSYGSELVLVVPDMIEFEEGSVDFGAAVVDGCDQASPDAAARAAASAVILNVRVMNVSYRMQLGATRRDEAGSADGDGSIGASVGFWLRAQCGQSHAKTSPLTAP